MKRALLVMLMFLGCREAAPQPDTGCGGRVEDPLTSILVRSARLEAVGMWQGGLGLGHAEGDARLVIIDTEGERHQFRARLDGTHAGLTADLSMSPQAGPYALRLPAGTTLNARQVLGSYSGLHVGLTAVVGVHFRELENDSNVKLNLTGLTLGVGAVPASWEGLDLQLWNDPRRVVSDETESCGFFGCTPDDEDDFDDDDDFDQCVGLGFECELDWDECCDGACVGSDADGVGTCRPVCGAIVEDEDGVARAERFDNANCLDGATCQVVTRLPDLALDAVACVPPAAPLDAPCTNALDLEHGDATCAEGLDCTPAGLHVSWDGAQGVQTLRCRAPCDPTDDASAAACEQEERVCLAVPVTVQLGPTQHVCATPVPSVTFALWEQTAGVLGDGLRCDEIDENAVCSADAAAVGSSAPAFATCLATNRVFAPSFCVTVCALPAFDTDGDGVITPDVDIAAWEGECASGYDCRGELAARLDLGDEVRTCEPIPE